MVALGSDYMLQLKYSKGSMAKFDVLGTMLLMYEVPYIAVPTLKDADYLSDKEVEMIKPIEEVEV